MLTTTKPDKPATDYSPKQEDAHCSCWASAAASLSLSLPANAMGTSLGMALVCPEKTVDLHNKYHLYSANFPEAELVSPSPE
jgi:hypothetical protein